MKQLPLRKHYLKVITLLFMFTASTAMLWAQEMNEKFALTTQMFLNEQKKKAEQPTTKPRQVPGLKLSEKMLKQKPQRLIASPDTIGGVAYISCFIHLKDVSDLSAVRSLGVEVEETFDGLDFVTARVPLKKLEKLADIDNVTRIKVAECMRPMTDVARQKTNVDDLLKLSADATAVGINTKYDGTGVVLGIIDTGIDFQHIAFKDKNGKSRIKGAYVYDGSSASEYTTITNTSPTTDNEADDHGTHTASIAGGSSVIVNGSTITVTDNHANATYGGMAPGTDLYLAGVQGLRNSEITNVLKKMVTYADAQGKPLVVSNSWGSQWGPHDGTGELADLVGQYFGDSHPGHVILFSASNNVGHSKDNEGGGYFVKKSSASSSSPLGTILRSNTYSNTDAGYYYPDDISLAFSTKKLNCKIYVLNSSTGAVIKSWTVTSNTTSFSGLDTYYDGTLEVTKGWWNDEKYCIYVSTDDGLQTKDWTITTQNGEDYYKSAYTLAIEVYPASGSANVEIFGMNDDSYFTNHLTTSGHTWTAGTDDMCVNDQATIPDAISVGSYVSKNNWANYQGVNYYNYNVGTLGDIASSSGYATVEQSPTGFAYPWITAPGAFIVSGVNHYHTTSVDDNSYFSRESRLVVNSEISPYALMSGTSMATPVAAGIVALWLQAAKSVNKNLTVNDVKNIMEQTAIHDNYTNGTNASHFGKGKIDALAGIKHILDTSGGSTGDVNELYAEDIQIKTGTTTADLEICMRNVAEIGGFSFKLRLPEGVAMALNKDGEKFVEINEKRLHIDEYTYFGVTKDDLIYYSSLSPITGNDGLVITLPLTIAEEVASIAGTHQINVYDISISSLAGQSVATSTEFTTNLSVVEESPAINFADANVKKICVENWDTNKDGELSEEEAAKVTDLGEVFEMNKNITSFNELQYFTGLKSLGGSVFYRCSSLTSVVIPSSVTSIGMNAFRECSSMTSVTIPSSVNSIDDFAFAECPKITSIKVDEGNATYDSRGDCNAIIETTTNNLIVGCKNTKIPDSVSSINKESRGAFFGCSGLTSITIPSNVTYIGMWAFGHCSGLTSVTIPGSVTSIGYSAFGYCSSLTDVYCLAENVPKTNVYAFDESSIASAALHVPAISLNAYKTTAPWSDFGTIVAIDNGTVKKGDLNGDGTVSITDVVMIIDVIADPITYADKKAAADVNDDGSVTITDCVAAIDLIAAQSSSPRPARTKANKVFSNMDFISANMQDGQLTVNLDNEKSYTAFHMIVNMPEGMNLGCATMDKTRGANHQAVIRNLGNGQYLVAGFSANNDEFIGNSGSLFSIVTDGLVEGDIFINDIEFATTQAEACYLADITLSSTPTGINEMKNEELNDIYDLQGHRVVKPSKGLYIYNGKKTVIK